MVKSSFLRETRMQIHRSSVRPDSSSHTYRFGRSSRVGSYHVQAAGRPIEITGVSGGATRRASEIGQLKKTKAQSAESWVQSHAREIRRQKGRWVAIEKNGIVATSKSFENVYKLAAKRGARNPLVFKVPSNTGEKRIVSVRT